MSGSGSELGGLPDWMVLLLIVLFLIGAGIVLYIQPTFL